MLDHIYLMFRMQFNRRNFTKIHHTVRHKAVMKPDYTRYCVGTFIIVTIVGALCGVFLVKRPKGNVTTLKQIYVIFSHGKRTPMQEEIESFPLSVNRNETYYPYGYDALTNEGKITMFQLGTLIRKRYNEFLANEYSPTIFEMQSIDTDLAKTSALLVQAGLWLVENDKTWNKYQWQPIPYKSMEISKDFMFYHSNCPRYNLMKRKLEDEFLERTDLPYTELFRVLSLYTGSNITTLSQVYHLVNLIWAQQNFGETIPKWFINMENMIYNVIHSEYKHISDNIIMQKLSTGYLFRRILDDTNKLIKLNKEDEKNKMVLFSGYPTNIVGLLTVTKKLHYQYHRNLGSMFIIELHLTPEDNKYAYKIFYHNEELPEPQELELENCKAPCLVEDLKSTMRDILIEDYESECKIIL